MYAFHGFLFRFIEFLDVKYGRDFQEHAFNLASKEDMLDMLEASREAGVCGSGFFIQRWESFIASTCPNLELDFIKHHLDSVGALKKNGEVSLSFVADTIGADQNRLGRSEHFCCYISSYLRGEQISDLPLRKDKTVSQLATWFNGISQIFAAVPNFSKSELADHYGVSELLRIYNRSVSDRTKSIPYKIGRKLIFECCSWVITFDRPHARGRPQSG